MKVQEIMANDPVCCAPNTSLQEVAALMADRHYGEIPVCESGSKKPIGVITDRDITCRVVAKGRNPSELTVREFMTSPCITVTAESDVDECCRLMEEHMIRRLPVVDANGNLQGIVSLADVVRNADKRNTSRLVKGVSQPYEHAARLVV